MTQLDQMGPLKWLANLSMLRSSVLDSHFIFIFTRLNLMLRHTCTVIKSFLKFFKSDAKSEEKQSKLSSVNLAKEVCPFLASKGGGGGGFVLKVPYFLKGLFNNKHFFLYMFRSGTFNNR